MSSMITSASLERQRSGYEQHLRTARRALADL